MKYLAQLENGMNKLFLPMGLLYLADALEKTGGTAQIYHEFGNLEAINSLVAKVKADKPDWVGFSVMTSPQLVPTIIASKRIKQETDVPIVWGGLHSIMVGIDEPFVDVSVEGEGESWVTRQPVKDLDLFQPAWHLIDSKRYGRTIHLVTSRGCPYRCGFCYSPAVWKRKWKCHSVQKVIKIFNSYPLEPSKVEFRDDNFFVDKKRGVEIVNKLGIPWSATIRADMLSESLVKSLTVQPESLLIGVESASQRLLNLLTKDISVADIWKALRLAHRYDINLFLTFIVNLPSETEDENKATLKMIDRIKMEYSNVQCNVYEYFAYPKTALFNTALQWGFNPPKTTSEWVQYACAIWRKSAKWRKKHLGENLKLNLDEACALSS